MGRTYYYVVWKACERFNILPPGVKKEFDENDFWTQSCILAYDSIRSQEEQEFQVSLAGAKF